MPEWYAQQYLFIGLLAGVAVILGVAPLVLARFIAPRKPGASKQSAYECGLPAVRAGRVVLVDGIELLAALLHPDRCADLADASRFASRGRYGTVTTKAAYESADWR